MFQYIPIKSQEKTQTVLMFIIARENVILTLDAMDTEE